MTSQPRQPNHLPAAPPRCDLLEALGHLWQDGSCPRPALGLPPEKTTTLGGQTDKTLDPKMHKALLTSLAATALAAMIAALPAAAETRGYYEVVGVDEDDMLKMRAGPGVGYRIVVGLPNGTVVWVQSCERLGNTSWCKVALKQARGLKGYVSSAYLQKQ